MPNEQHQELGEYIVADPEICGGALTFKGTRILVKDVLFLLAQGYDGQRISAEYDGRLPQRAITEAVEVAFAQGILSSGKAAALLNLSRIEFLDHLRARGLAYVNYSAEELADEFAAVETLNREGVQ